MNFGFRFFAPHVLLPGLEQVLVAGGSPSHIYGGTTSTGTAELIDFTATTPAWSYTGAMNYPRYNENLVLSSATGIGGKTRAPPRGRKAATFT